MHSENGKRYQPDPVSNLTAQTVPIPFWEAPEAGYWFPQPGFGGFFYFMPLATAPSRAPDQSQSFPPGSSNNRPRSLQPPGGLGFYFKQNPDTPVGSHTTRGPGFCYMGRGRGAPLPCYIAPQNQPILSGWHRDNTGQLHVGCIPAARGTYIYTKGVGISFGLPGKRQEESHWRRFSTSTPFVDWQRLFVWACAWAWSPGTWHIVQGRKSPAIRYGRRPYQVLPFHTSHPC